MNDITNTELVQTEENNDGLYPLREGNGETAQPEAEEIFITEDTADHVAN